MTGSIEAIKPAEPRIRASIPTAVVLAGLLLVASNLRAAITTVGPLVVTMERDLGISLTAASALISLPLVAFAVVSPFAPALARRFGLERAIAGALVVLAAGLVLRSVPPLALLWIGTVLIGVAIAMLNVLLPSLVKRDFPTRIGEVTGTYSAVQSSFAALAAGVAVPVAGMTALGWRLPLGMWAGLALIALGVLAPQLRRRTGASADGSSSSSGHHAVPQVRSPWRSAIAWHVTVFMGLQSVVFYVLVMWMPSIEVEAGVSESAAGMHLLLLNAAGIVGSLVCSALIPRLPDQRLLAAGGSLTLLIGSAGLLVAPQLGAVWGIIAGFGCGACIVLALSFFSLRTRHHAHAAAMSGMAQCIGYVFAALGPVAFGLIYDLFGSWKPALALLVAATVVDMVFGYLAGRRRTL